MEESQSAIAAYCCTWTMFLNYYPVCISMNHRSLYNCEGFASKSLLLHNSGWHNTVRLIGKLQNLSLAYHLQYFLVLMNKYIYFFSVYIFWARYRLKSINSDV